MACSAHCTTACSIRIIFWVCLAIRLIALDTSRAWARTNVTGYRTEFQFQWRSVDKPSVYQPQVHVLQRPGEIHTQRVTFSWPYFQMPSEIAHSQCLRRSSQCVLRPSESNFLNPVLPTCSTFLEQKGISALPNLFKTLFIGLGTSSH